MAAESEARRMKVKYSKTIVGIMIGFTVAFVAAALLIDYRGGSVSDKLIDRVFDWIGNELMLLAGIKTVDQIAGVVTQIKGAAPDKNTNKKETKEDG